MISTEHRGRRAAGSLKTWAAGAVGAALAVAVAPHAALAWSSPDLRAESAQLADVVQPGSTIALPVIVDNVARAGEEGTTAHGVSISIMAGADSFVTRHDNCWYGAYSTTCRFPSVVVAPGERFALSPETPLAYRVSPDTPELENARVLYSVHAMSSVDDQPPWGTQQGDGPSLVLVGGPGAKPADDRNNAGAITFHTGPNPTDIVAIGTQVSAPGGESVPITFGVRNDGPAYIDANSGRAASNWEPVWVDFAAPAGTEVESIDSRCAPFVDGAVDRSRAGAGGFARYECGLGIIELDGYPVGWSELWNGTLKVTGTVSGPGTVTAHISQAEGNPANDTAPIEITQP
ncbi:hypothetical protein ACTOB_006922 [Actinoplanes oblitus]|uniref:Uncharacterized protein n=1 Tax=Actinoplanes oblitus TaxID=3040509 RepID=A0ABY8WAH6_9ACTN|nr:hypothetical protein [Actinoplanes oblitus]WIM94864.1 hypothetical protein ACTOB_006922 [Actinoplanes oblitus]